MLRILMCVPFLLCFSLTELLVSDTPGVNAIFFWSSECHFLHTCYIGAGSGIVCLVSEKKNGAPKHWHLTELARTSKPKLTVKNFLQYSSLSCESWSGRCLAELVLLLLYVISWRVSWLRIKFHCALCHSS